MWLVKLSSPGWGKHYGTSEGLVDELRKHICPGCLDPHPDDWWAPTVDVEHDGVRYLCRDVGTLLSTSCGCEYAVYTDEELKKYEKSKTC